MAAALLVLPRGQKQLFSSFLIPVTRSYFNIMKGFTEMGIEQMRLNAELTGGPCHLYCGSCGGPALPTEATFTELDD